MYATYPSISGYDAWSESAGLAVSQRAAHRYAVLQAVSESRVTRSASPRRRRLAVRRARVAVRRPA